MNRKCKCHAAWGKLGQEKRTAWKWRTATAIAVTAIGIVGFLFLTGCASVPSTPEEQYERENTRIEAVELFWADHDACLAQGGVIDISLDPRVHKPVILRRRPDYSIWEMRSMRCDLR